MNSHISTFSQTEINIGLRVVKTSTDAELFSVETTRDTERSELTTVRLNDHDTSNPMIIEVDIRFFFSTLL